MVAKNLDPKRLKYLFFAIFAIEILVNYDSGAVPAVLNQIKAEFNFEPIELGLLGGLQYVGLTVMSLLSGHLLAKYSVKKVLAISLIVNTSFCIVLATAQNGVKASIFISRAGIGLSQTAVVVYAPVWVDEFAPDSSRTLWMSLVQAGVPLGVMLGYTAAGFLSNAGVNWRASIWVQALLLLPLSIGAFFVPSRYLKLSEEGEEEEGEGEAAAPAATPSTVATPTAASESEKQSLTGSAGSDTATAAAGWDSLVPGADGAAAASAGEQAQGDGEAQGEEEGEEGEDMLTALPSTTSATSVASNGSGSGSGLRNRRRSRVDSLYQYTSGQTSAAHISVRKQLRILWRSRLFVSLCLALSSLFFVVTGVQFWITDYFLTVLNTKYSTVLIGFALCSATGPTLGVIFGGILVDRCGGYKGTEGMARTANILASFALCAFLCAIPAGFTTHFLTVIVLLWLLLFFGGAILPAATGLVLSSVPRSLRAFSSAVAMMLYNVLGYAAGTFLPGLLMQAVKGGGVSEATALTWGVRLILWWSFFGVLFVSLAVVVARRRHQHHSDSSSRPEVLRKQRRVTMHAAMLAQQQPGAGVEMTSAFAAAGGGSGGSSGMFGGNMLEEGGGGARFPAMTAEFEDAWLQMDEDYMEAVTAPEVEYETARRMTAVAGTVGGLGMLARTRARTFTH